MKQKTEPITIWKHALQAVCPTSFIISHAGKGGKYSTIVTQHSRPPSQILSNNMHRATLHNCLLSKLRKKCAIAEAITIYSASACIGHNHMDFEHLSMLSICIARYILVIVSKSGISCLSPHVWYG